MTASRGTIMLVSTKISNGRNVLACLYISTYIMTHHNASFNLT